MLNYPRTVVMMPVNFPDPCALKCDVIQREIERELGNIFRAENNEIKILLINKVETQPAVFTTQMALGRCSTTSGEYHCGVRAMERRHPEYLEVVEGERW
jgi:hypothetical protein